MSSQGEFVSRGFRCPTLSRSEKVLSQYTHEHRRFFYAESRGKCVLYCGKTFSFLLSVALQVNSLAIVIGVIQRLASWVTE